jgi:rhodanese-related sulfurtransferase
MPKYVYAAIAALSALFFLFTTQLHAAGPKDAPSVTAAELKAKFDKGAVVILDVRASGSYNKSKVKIKGAIRIAPEELADRLAEIPMGREIVTYCT